MAWQGSTDGTPWMQRTLIRLFRILPLGLLYGVMALVIPFYVIFDRKSRRASYSFFSRHIGYGAVKSALHVFSNMYNMGKVVMDRFAAYAGRRFTITGPGKEIFEGLSASDGAFIMLSSHCGNFEMSGYMLRAEKKMNVLVYAGETETVMQNRDRLFAHTNVQMVPVSEDMSHIFALNNALANGEIASLPADRPFGSEKTVKADFLGAEASFPAGPFTLAAQRGTPAYAVFVMKESMTGYRFIMEKLEAPEDGIRTENVNSLARAYARCLENTVRRYPDQWYNFYDFWA